MEAMKITAEDKEWIDDASYFQLLRRWRFGNIGDTLLMNATGEYFGKIMHEKKIALSQEEQVRISKQIGWE